jgi:hypothetical protein
MTDHDGVSNSGVVDVEHWQLPLVLAFVLKITCPSLEHTILGISSPYHLVMEISRLNGKSNTLSTLHFLVSVVSSYILVC